MTTDDWPSLELPERLGVVAHGPALLAQAPDIAAGLRCVWARPEGLLLPVVVQARGVHADAASRQTFGGSDPVHPDGDAADVFGSAVRVVARAGDREVELDSAHGTASAGDDDFTAEAAYWLPGVPDDGLLHLTVAWPEAGLPETTTTLRLEGLHDLETRALRLLG
ncbi:hypothetical protein [Quadrisphaera sp. INWT6]|uniref:hypothetical protein n=1 Tax=Quadrisphaera sp. INWT6 TaxID=2596917 RepID=UPI0018924893|nr:hypothetical protein [Quadrisphaera sp. INWT6]MBF5083432.1 hypothetical protein [Quadrisphaera sp. INWT6]